MPTIKELLLRPTSLSSDYQGYEIFDLKPSAGKKLNWRDDNNSLANFAKRTEEVKLSLHDRESRYWERQQKDRQSGLPFIQPAPKVLSSNPATRFYQTQAEQYLNQQRRRGLTKPLRSLTESTDDQLLRTVSVTSSARMRQARAELWSNFKRMKLDDHNRQLGKHNDYIDEKTR